jgi:hypothetical protein
MVGFGVKTTGSFGKELASEGKLALSKRKRHQGR